MARDHLDIRFSLSPIEARRPAGQDDAKRAGERRSPGPLEDYPRRCGTLLAHLEFAGDDLREALRVLPRKETALRRRIEHRLGRIKAVLAAINAATQGDIDAATQGDAS